MLWSLLLTVCYVSPLYLFDKTRPAKLRFRDDPQVVSARLTVISVVSLALLVATGWVFPGADLRISVSATGASQALLLTAVLFAGPIFEKLVDGVTVEYLKEEFTDIFALRNYVIGPLTEEIVFRSCLIASLEQDGWSRASLIWLSPLFFGVAHLHHCYEKYLQVGDLKNCILESLFQLLYTTVFGWYATYLLITTNTISAPVAAHVFCNVLGPPQPSIARYNSVYYLILFGGLSTFIYLLNFT